MENHEAVSVGDLDNDSVVLPTVDPEFSVDCPETEVCEGAEPLVDDNWYTVCQAIKKASKVKSGKGCTASMWKVNLRPPSTGRKVKTWWKIRSRGA